MNNLVRAHLICAVTLMLTPVTAIADSGTTSVECSSPMAPIRKCAHQPRERTYHQGDQLPAGTDIRLLGANYPGLPAAGVDERYVLVEGDIYLINANQTVIRGFNFSSSFNL